MELAQAIVEAAKALGGSFKLVTLTPNSTAHGKHKKGTNKQIKETQMNTQNTNTDPFLFRPRCNSPQQLQLTVVESS